jgi:hypothetical protein
MRRIGSSLVLALVLAACGSAPSNPVSTAPTPDALAVQSGEPIGLVGYGVNGDMPCQGAWVEGLLRGDVELHDRLLGNSQGPITIEIWPLDTVEWPAASGVERERFVALRWPLEYRGVRLADGQVVVVDGADKAIAVTGHRYRLEGDWAVVAAIGGPLFGKPPWIDAFNVCRGSEAVIPQ